MKDLAEGTFVKKFPIWLRWILFIPSAFIVPIIIQAIGRISAVNYGGMSSESFFLDLYGDFVLGFGITIIGALVAPKNQFIISIILLVFLSIILIGPFISPYSFTMWGITTFTHALITLIAAIISVYELYKFSIQQKEDL